MSSPFELLAFGCGTADRILTCPALIKHQLQKVYQVGVRKYPILTVVAEKPNSDNKRSQIRSLYKSAATHIVFGNKVIEDFYFGPDPVPLPSGPRNRVWKRTKRFFQNQHRRRCRR